MVALDEGRKSFLSLLGKVTGPLQTPNLTQDLPNIRSQLHLIHTFNTEQLVFRLLDVI